MTSYTLETMTLPVGTVKIYLLHTSATLNIPTRNLSFRVSDIVTLIDEEPGWSQLENLTLEALECYDDYTEGFWNYTIENGDAELRITVTESAVEKTLFWGVIDRNVSRYKEHYVSGTTHRRTVSLVFRDLLYRLKGITSEALVTEVLTHDTLYNEYGTANNWTYIKLKGILASMLVLAYGQTYNEAHVTVVNDDMRYYNDRTTNAFTFDDLWVFTSSGYFNNADATYGFKYKYAYASDILSAILRNFGLVTLRSYDGTNHKFNLYSRGRNYGANITPPSLIDSDVKPGLYASAGNIRCSLLNAAEEIKAWDLNGVYRSTTSTLLLPGWAAFDVDVDVVWTADYNNPPSRTGPTQRHTEFGVIEGGKFEYITQSYYYDYVTGGFTSASKDNQFIDSLVKYYRGRWAGNRRELYRTYAGLKADAGSGMSVDNFHPMREFSHNDGLGAKTYYAVRLKKNLYKNTTEVQWAQQSSS